MAEPGRVPPPIFIPRHLKLGQRPSMKHAGEGFARRGSQPVQAVLVCPEEVDQPDQPLTVPLIVPDSDMLMPAGPAVVPPAVPSDNTAPWGYVAPHPVRPNPIPVR